MEFAKNNSDILYFYYDTIESQLNISAFKQMVDSINIVSNTVSQVCLNEKSKCQIFILPPESGSFKSKFIIIVTTAAIGLCTNLGDGFIEGLTGHNTSYYGKSCGKFIKDATIGIFSKTKDELSSIIPDNVILDSAIEAKSKFYTSIINDKNIISLGFSENNNKQVDRINMGAYISNDIIRDVDNIEEYAKLTIIKPVTVESQQAWTLKDQAKTRSDDYKIMDNEFKNLVLNGNNPLKESKKPDEILAKIEYIREMKNGVICTTETNIKEVYQFNDKELKKIPNDFKLNSPKNKKSDSTNHIQLKLKF